MSVKAGTEGGHRCFPLFSPLFQCYSVFRFWIVGFSSKGRPQNVSKAESVLAIIKWWEETDGSSDILQSPKSQRRALELFMILNASILLISIIILAV